MRDAYGTRLNPPDTAPADRHSDHEHGILTA